MNEFKKYFLFIVMICFIIFLSCCQSESDKYIGLWNTHDESTGNEKIISINKDGEYYIVKTIGERVKDSLFYTLKDGQFSLAPIGTTYQQFASFGINTDLATISYSEKSNQVLFFRNYYTKVK